jgi:hypothetical protein
VPERVSREALLVLNVRDRDEVCLFDGGPILRCRPCPRSLRYRIVGGSLSPWRAMTCAHLQDPGFGYDVE